MPIDDPKQNIHKWCGELTIDDDTEIVGGTLKPGTRCVFVKTSATSHFVTHGTYVKKVRLVSSKSDAISAVEGNLQTAMADMGDDFDLADAMPVVEILEINKSRTSPLTNKLNEFIEKLFSDDAWLDASAAIGQEKIKQGRKMPALK